MAYRTYPGERVHLHGGEQFWVVRVTDARYGDIPYFIVAETEAGAKRKALHEAEPYQGTEPAKVVDIEVDNSWLCEHCGLVGGH